MAIKKTELYSTLWQSCDELRGGMDASQYKDYVLILLFVKYVSDKYAGRKDAQIEVPPGASFKDMVALKGDKEIGDKINKLLAKLAEEREQIVHRWYRDQLKAMLPPLIEKWEKKLGVRVDAWGIKKMKTRWGSCNPAAHRVWFNLELAKKPDRCLEYLVVHELVHLLERHHNDRFKAVLDKHLPHWRSIREELNRAPLGHEKWEY
jgi:predicted metal-dependent hydrolase